MATPTTQIEPTLIEEQVLGLIRELLRELGSHQAAGRVSLDSSFDRDLGLGSLERVELLVRCEARFDKRLPDEIAQNGETPAEWVRAIVWGGAEEERRPRYRITPPARQAPPAPESAVTLAEALRRHAEIEPDRVQIHLLEEDSGQDITYGELLEAASEVASGLAAAGLERNQTAAIMLPTCADFFRAFFGVILAGGIPVPVYPPARPDKIEEYVRRQTAILANAEIRFLITFARIKAVSQLMRVNLPSLREVTSVEALRQSGGRPAAAAPSETGFIQYTSGSTGDPKGVVLSHANILANIRGIGQGVRVRPDDVVVSWLPLYHDMGLIGSWLFSLYYAIPITVLSPLAFLSRPERWLWALHDARGTLCPAPNFSFELCARKIPARALEGLDLSSWRVAINAGEAVLPDTIARFTQRFGPYGFRAESMLPCYGLAESSVALSVPPIDRAPLIDAVRRAPFEERGAAEPAGPEETAPLRFVSAGPPLPGHEARILDERGRPVAERLQGRLWFRGPSRTAGYYRNPAATAAVMRGGWMDSGDLAYLAGGEIYITGRRKDCIIKAGRNILPQEVEAAAADVPGVRRGCVAAIGVTDGETGTERLVVVAETRATSQEELRRIEAGIISGVDAAVGIPPDRVELISPQSIPKTSSGKIRRSETKSLFLNGALETRKPAWLQIVLLWLESAGWWARLGGRRALERAGGWYVRAAVLTTCAGAGLLVRLAPGIGAKCGILRWAARGFLRLRGWEVTSARAGEAPAECAALLVANRAGVLDPLVLAAVWETPFLLADGVSHLPRAAEFLLRPLVIPGVSGETAPAGGTLRQRIRQALDRGHAVLVFPDGPVGLSPLLSRFRLDAFQAAVETGSPLHPIAVMGTFPLLEAGGRPAPRKNARVVEAAAIVPEASRHREILRLRDQVRETIAGNYQ